MPEVELSKISLTGWNPRKSMDKEAFEELKKSIAAHGILQPIVVRPVDPKKYIDLKGKPAGEMYELVAGERRFKAAQELKLDKVPVVVKDLTDVEVREIMLIENLQRSQLDPLEEASALDVLLKDGITQEDLGKKLGKSQAWIANRLRLLQAPKELQDLLISGEITPKHVLSVLSLAKYPVYKTVIAEIKKEVKSEEGLSVSKLEELVHDVFEGFRGDVDEDSFASLSNPPYEIREFVNITDCKKCENARSVKESDGDEKFYCMEKKCFDGKIAAARAKYAANQAEKMKTLQSKKVVNLANMNYNQYTWFHADNLLPEDAKKCKDCSNCKKDKAGNLICLDPACYRKKESAKTREATKKARAESDAAYKDIDKLTEKKDFYSPRGILRIMADDLMWGNAAKNALRPWGEIKDSGKILAVAEKIPDADIEKAILRLVIFQKIERWGISSLTRKNVESIVKKYKGR